VKSRKHGSRSKPPVVSNSRPDGETNHVGEAGIAHGKEFNEPVLAAIHLSDDFASLHKTEWICFSSNAFEGQIVAAATMRTSLGFESIVSHHWKKSEGVGWMTGLSETPKTLSEIDAMLMASDDDIPASFFSSGHRSACTYLSNRAGGIPSAEKVQS